MSPPGIIDRSIQDFRTWLREIRTEADLADEQLAYDALRGALHTVRDRLIAGEATDLGAQLPTLVRGVYYEGYAPQKTRSEGEFLDALSRRTEPAPAFDHGAAALAVFACIDCHLDPNEMDEVIGQMSKDVQALWPEEARLRVEAKRAA